MLQFNKRWCLTVSFIYFVWHYYYTDVCKIIIMWNNDLFERIIGLNFRKCRIIGKTLSTIASSLQLLVYWTLSWVQNRKTKWYFGCGGFWRRESMVKNVQQTLWTTTRTYRAPFGIVKNTDECHGLLIEVHVFRLLMEGFSKVCHEESTESILKQRKFPAMAAR